MANELPDWLRSQEMPRVPADGSSPAAIPEIIIASTPAEASPPAYAAAGFITAQETDDTRQIAESAQPDQHPETEAVHPSELPPDNPIPPDEATAQPIEEGPKMWHVQAVERTKSQDAPGDTVKVHASPEAIAYAFREGEKVIFSITREAPNGPLIYEATTPALPAHATKTEVNTAPEAPADSATPAAPTDLVWTRLNQEQRTTPKVADKNQSQQPPTEGFNIHGLITNYGGPFKIVIEADPVSAEDHKHTLARIQRKIDVANETEGLERRAAELQVTYDHLNSAYDDGLGRRQIAIAAPDSGALKDVARHIVGSVLTSDTTTYSTVTSPTTGGVQEYPSREAAIATGAADPKTLVTAQQFSKTIQYPSKEIPGMGIKDAHNFGVNVRRSENAIDIGRIKYAGKEAGGLPIDPNILTRHALVVAETGSGKTVLMREIICKVMADSYHRGQPLLVLVVDQMKSGSYDSVTDTLVGMGLPVEAATAVHIRPGDDKYHARLDVFEPQNSTPTEQLSDVVRSLALSTEGDNESRRMQKRYSKDGGMKSYKTLGWDMEDNTVSYPNGTPAPPTMPFLAANTRHSVHASDYDNRVSGNVAEYTGGHIEQANEGVAGRFFTEGNRIDFDAVLQAPLVIFGLKNLEGATPRNIASSIIFRKIVAARKAELARLGKFESSQLRVLMVFDEAGETFSNTESGGENADQLTVVRYLGIGALVGVTGNLAKIHPNAISNTHTVLTGRVTNPADLEILAGKGNTTVKDLGYLATEEVQPGSGLAFVDGQDLPVPYETTPMNELPVGKGNNVGPDSVVNKGLYSELEAFGVSLENRPSSAKIKKFLTDDHDGVLVRAWAEINAGLDAKDHKPANLSGTLRTALLSKKGDDAVVRDFAILEAVDMATSSRQVLKYTRGGREGTSVRLLRNMLGQVHGGLPKGVTELRQLDHCLDIGHYTEIEDHLLDYTTARSITVSPERQEVIGHQTLLGVIAEEQLEALDRAESTLVHLIANTIKNEAGVPINLVAATTAANEVLKLTGPAPTVPGLRYVRGKVTEALGAELNAANNTALKHIVDTLAVVRTIVEKSDAATEEEAAAAVMDRYSNDLDRTLSPAEASSVQKLVHAVIYASADSPPETSTIRRLAQPLLHPNAPTGIFPALRHDLQGAITDCKSRPGLDLNKAYGLRYNETFLDSSVPAIDQLEDIRRRQHEYTKGSKQPPVILEDLIFAPNLLGGAATTLDHIAAWLVEQTEPQGYLADAQRDIYGMGRTESYSLLRLLETNNPKVALWGALLSQEVLLSGNFSLTVGGTAFLKQTVARYTQAMHERAKIENARRAAQGNGTAQ